MSAAYYIPILLEAIGSILHAAAELFETDYDDLVEKLKKQPKLLDSKVPPVLDLINASLPKDPK
jgi:hypothetical protein